MKRQRQVNCITLDRINMYLIHRAHIEALWELVSKPIKFPNRRRREDREIPKAA